ncbi:hypothetical protein AB5I41_01075 [Sphingomonas sp. MMS24-JH45]
MVTALIGFQAANWLSPQPTRVIDPVRVDPADCARRLCDPCRARLVDRGDARDAYWTAADDAVKHGRMKATIWHNPRCSKSREALAILEGAGASVEVVEYLKTPPTRAELARVYTRAGVAPRDGLRRDARPGRRRRRRARPDGA